jgi:DNA-binding transcriptional ArsR family regulator
LNIWPMIDPPPATRIFRALSAPVRVHIVQLLKARSLCVKALADRLDVSAAAVSQHLRILRDADLVVGEKRGNHVHYRVDPETLGRWRRLADELLSMDGARESTP